MPTLSDNLTESQKMVVIQNSVLEQQAKLDRHHKLLIEGNGELPLLERVRNLESFVGGLKFWLRTLSVALVLQTVTFATAAVVYFIRLYPLLEKISNQP